MITDRHSVQSPVAVPSYRSTRKNHRLFNVMREAVVSQVSHSIPHLHVWSRLIPIRVIERDHSARHERACGPIDELEGALEIR